MNQLDILSKTVKTSKNNIDSLESVLDMTFTAMGKRYLQNILVNPMTDVDYMKKSYERINVLKTDDVFREKIITMLKGLPDLERLQRRLLLNIIKPQDFSKLFKSYAKVIQLYSLLYKCKHECFKDLLFERKIAEEFNKCTSMVYKSIDLDKLEVSQIDNDGKIMKFKECPIYQTANSEMKKCYMTITLDMKRINLIIEHLNGFLPKGEWIKFKELPKSAKDKEDAENEDNWLITTTSKSMMLRSKIKQINVEICGELHFTNVKNNAFIHSNVIDELCDRINTNSEKLKQEAYKFYTNLLKTVSKEYNFHSKIDDFASKVDFYMNGARVATKYKHFMPTIDNEAKCSFFCAKDLRHPFAEHIIDFEYIPNDIYINQDTRGMLIYGTNSSGKSTLTKSVGLNIILAQMGYYTAGNVTFKPYSKIITRLSGNDDIVNGKSSFIIEMLELKTILKEADENTLVLGDELCRGPEISSATGLTIATICQLVDRKSSFLFSSHQHHLTTNKYMKNIPEKTLRICHLSMEYNVEKDQRIYNRKLQDGQGSTIYGIEVAKSLKLDSEFINLANKIRKELSGQNTEILSTKKSNYTSKLYMDSCAFCGTSGKGLHSHHIAPQKESDSDGFIKHYHKDKLFNLLVLCEGCHEHLHKTNKKLLMQQTLQGNIISTDI